MRVVRRYLCKNPWRESAKSDFFNFNFDTDTCFVGSTDIIGSKTRPSPSNRHKFFSRFDATLPSFRNLLPTRCSCRISRYRRIHIASLLLRTSSVDIVRSAGTHVVDQFGHESQRGEQNFGRLSTVLSRSFLARPLRRIIKDSQFRPGLLFQLSHRLLDQVES
jgi:hypothetical protein